MGRRLKKKFTKHDTFRDPGVPRQKNGYDCEVFLCLFKYSKAAGLVNEGDDSFSFTQADVNYQGRVKIELLIIEEQIIA